MKALVLVDIQNDFLPGGAFPVKKGNEILPIIEKLVSLPFDVIVATQDWHPADHGSFAVNHGKKPGEKIMLGGIEQILWPVHCIQGTPGADFSPGWDTKKIAKIFFKGTDKMIDSYSTFFDNGHHKSTGLDKYLRQRGVKEIFLAGLATDYCVKWSALDALKLGFAVYVIVDACRGINLQPADTEKALNEMKAAGAILTTSREIFGVAGFEPTTSSSRTKRASQTALHPDAEDMGNSNR